MAEELRYSLIGLLLLGLVEYLCGAALCIMAPFYTEQAANKGLSGQWEVLQVQSCFEKWWVTRNFGKELFFGKNLFSQVCFDFFFFIKNEKLYTV